MISHDDRSGGIMAIAPDEGEAFNFRDFSGQIKITGAASNNQLAVAEMPAIPPKLLAAPLHRHHNEDEYTYVVGGTLGVMVEGEVVHATPGMCR